MELTGSKKFAGRVVAVAAVGLGGSVVAIPVAPIATAQEPAIQTWTMPATRGEVLQSAVDSVVAAAGPENVSFNFVTRPFNQVVYNLSNWVVCGQSPSGNATVKMGSKPRAVNFAVARPSEGC